MLSKYNIYQGTIDLRTKLIIDDEISEAIKLYESNNKLEITYRILSEKYKWLYNNFDLSQLQIDDFVKNNNLIGFIPVTNITGISKMYFYKCNTCLNNKNSGIGIFSITRQNYNKGIVSCDCSKTPKLTKYQYIIKIYEHCKILGYTFCGFFDDWKSKKSKGLIHLKLYCKTHGYWYTSTIDNFLFHSRACSECGKERQHYANLKDDSIHIKDFFNTKAFHADTKFWRSEKLNNYGYPNYWFYYCPRCETIAESQMSNLKEGKLSCLCNSNVQKQCYINSINDNDILIALKYGIANVYKSRVREQNRKSIFEIKNIGVWEFESVYNCKSAEDECHRTFKRILEKREMQDGYTETTSPLDYDKIVKIYENWGGIRIK